MYMTKEQGKWLSKTPEGQAFSKYGDDVIVVLEALLF
jgi:hypothetical protein